MNIPKKEPGGKRGSSNDGSGGSGGREEPRRVEALLRAKAWVFPV